jgi:hypothetical protein
MNEIRDLIVGIDFGESCSQLCYYDRKAEEPCSLTMKVGSTQYEIPNCLCRRSGQGEYYIGLEAEYFAREKDGVLFDRLYEISSATEKVRIAEEELEPYELLAIYLEGLLKFLGVMDVVRNTKALVITCPSLNARQVANWRAACESLGFTREQYIFMDYEESFYYYVFTQKKEIWNRKVAWYTFEGNKVFFRSFDINGSMRPIQIRLEDPVSVALPEEPLNRDGVFRKFIKETIGSDAYSSIHINGNGFDPEWAKDSVKLLCYQRRKVFYGNNLFARGACGAGMERKEKKNLKVYRYMSRSLVTVDVGMEMRVMGAPAYYPLIESGKNWYECSASCEILLDDTEELVFVVTGEDGEKKRVAMALPDLPKRPNKTTRLRIRLQYISKKECMVEAVDLGFGDLFPASGKIWKEQTQW